MELQKNAKRLHFTSVPVTSVTSANLTFHENIDKRLVRHEGDKYYKYEVNVEEVHLLIYCVC